MSSEQTRLRTRTSRLVILVAALSLSADNAAYSQAAPPLEQRHCPLLEPNASGVSAADRLAWRADSLFSDTQHLLRIEGQARIYFKGHVVCADKIIFDRRTSTLTADGNAVWRDPNGNVITGQRMTFSDDVTQAFIASVAASK
jgi:LPS-assembly protein